MQLSFMGEAVLGSAWPQQPVVTTKGEAQESCRERLYLEVVVSCRTLHFYNNSIITGKNSFWILLCIFANPNPNCVIQFYAPKINKGILFHCINGAIG